MYYEIGRAVCQRTEKGAAVAAATYLSEHYSDIQGFSPRNLRRMRIFCRTYEDHPDLLTLALQLGWTQNVAILEADLTMELQAWYLKAVLQFGWSKAELLKQIRRKACEEIALDFVSEICDNEKTKTRNRAVMPGTNYLFLYRDLRQGRSCSLRRKISSRKIMRFLISGNKRMAFIRCWRRLVFRVRIDDKEEDYQRRFLYENWTE